MTKRQVDQLKMLEFVADHFKSDEAAWSSNPLLVAAKAELSAKLDLIYAASLQQRHVSTGATTDKARLRKDLEDKAFFVSMALRAYVSLNPAQNILAETTFVTQTGLPKLRESDLLLYVERLQGMAMEVLDDLEHYGVSQATITALMAARTAFYDMMALPKELRTNVKKATATIADLLHQTIALLDNTMDQLVYLIKGSYPDFVILYKMARKIHRIGTRHLSLEITTLNAADKSPLAEAQIEIIDHHIKRISSQKGKNRVQNLKEGNYKLAVIHPDFVSRIIPFTVMSGQTTKLVVELKREVAEVQRGKGTENGRLKGSEDLRKF